MWDLLEHALRESDKEICAQVFVLRVVYGLNRSNLLGSCTAFSRAESDDSCVFITLDELWVVFFDA